MSAVDEAWKERPRRLIAALSLSAYSDRGISLTLDHAASRLRRLGLWSRATTAGSTVSRQIDGRNGRRGMGRSDVHVVVLDAQEQAGNSA